MNGTRICERLNQIVANDNLQCGRIHSVFRNSCNLVSDDDSLFVSLISSGKKLAPMSMMLDTVDGFDFRELGLKQGNYFSWTKNGIEFECNAFKVCTENVNQWSSECWLEMDSLRRTIDLRISEENNKATYEEHDRNDSRRNLCLRLLEFEQCLFEEGRFSGLEWLVRDLADMYPELTFKSEAAVSKMKHILEPKENTEFIKNRFLGFMEDYITGNRMSVNYSFGGIIGYGSGLTPAVDDFVNGLMITNIYMSKYWNIENRLAEEWNQRMLAGVLQKTTRVSEEMLKLGAQGLAIETVGNLIRELLSSRKVSTETVRQAIDYGETSGTDTALGIYTGLKLWTYYDYRRVMLNERLRGN